MGADGETADDHASITFNGSLSSMVRVHEGAGVTLVGVADEVAGRVGRFVPHFPLLAGGKTAAAAAAELRVGDFVDYPVWLVLFEHFGQRSKPR